MHYGDNSGKRQCNIVEKALLITFPLNRRFQPWIFCYDFPKTAKVVGKHTKEERKKRRKKERKEETDIGLLLF